MPETALRFSQNWSVGGAGCRGPNRTTMGSHQMRTSTADDGRF